MAVTSTEQSKQVHIWKQYPKYKPSGIDWLKEVPEGWEIIKTKYLLKRDGYRAGPFGRSLITSELLEKGKILVLTPKHIAEGSFDLPSNLYLPEKRRIEMSIFAVHKGDVVVPIVGTLGKALVIDSDIDAILNQCLVRLSPNSIRIVPEYLRMLLSEFDIYHTLDDVESKGAILNYITKDTLLNRKVPLPSVAEQEIIESYVNNETGRIDALIKKKVRQIELLKEKKAALIYHVVTKGLNPLVPMKDSGVEWLGMVPEDWKILHLGWGANLIVPMREKPPEFNGDIPWIRIEDFNGKYILDSKSDQRVSPEIVNKMNLKIFPVGTVLCSCHCTMGLTAIVAEPLISNQTFIGIVPKKELDSVFIYYLMTASGKWLQSIGNGAIKQYLSKEEFGHLKLALPRLPEQSAISTFLDRETTRIGTIIEQINTSIDKLKDYRSSFISAAMTGKIDLRQEIIQV